MLHLAINHVTCPDLSFAELLDLAARTACVGVEVRNDLSGDIFSGSDSVQALEMAHEKQLRILGLAQLNSFNCVSVDALDANLEAARQLIDIAVASGAESVCLIPRNDGVECEKKERNRNMRTALTELKPLFKDAGVVGMIEPLGFATSSLQSKREAVEAIVATDSEGCFQLVHDTFHHHLAEETECFASLTASFTGMVHVSGVVDAKLKPAQMQDNDRVLVNEHDQLNNLQQLDTLLAEGYQGPVSMEVFAPEVQQSSDLAVKLRDSFAFINSGLAARVA